MREAKWKEYLGHSVRRCLWVCSQAKHVQPRGSWGKKHCQYSPVGAWPEIRHVKRLKVTISPAMDMNFFPLSFQASGSSIRFFDCFLILSIRSLVEANVAHLAHHSETTFPLLRRNREVVVWDGAGYGPKGGESAAVSASSLMQKPRWLGIQQNSMSLLSLESIQCHKQCSFWTSQIASALWHWVWTEWQTGCQWRL